MPNHVKQVLTVVGPQNDVEAFVVTARGASPFTGDRYDENKPWSARKELDISPLCFDLVAPLPDEYCRVPYGTADKPSGYDMEINKWGVKWGPYDWDDELKPQPVMSSDGTQATYRFTCAWGPPVKALTRMSLRYRTLLFVLSWGGEGPCRGRHVFFDDECTYAQKDDYKTDIEPDIEKFYKSHNLDSDDDVPDDLLDKYFDVQERKYINVHEGFVDLQIKKHTQRSCLKVG